MAARFAIECDVQMSRDGEVFVFHDDTLDRMTDASGLLVEKSAAEIRGASLLQHRRRTSASPPPLWGRDRAGGRSDLGDKGVLSGEAWRDPPPQSSPTRGEEARGGKSPSPSPRPSPRTRGEGAIPTFSELLALVAGRAPIVCELKSRFDGDWRIGDRVAALVSGYEGPLALKSFDPDLVAYLRLRYPLLGPPGRPAPVGMVAEAAFDDPFWAFLTPEQKRTLESFDHRGRSEPDFLSWNVRDLPHRTPFFEKEFHGLPVMAWTVRSAADREAVRKWADQIVFEGEGRP